MEWKESNSACGQHREPLHEWRKCSCALLTHHCPPPFLWGEKGRPGSPKVVSAHSVKFYSMSAIASTVLSPWQILTNQANQNLCPHGLFLLSYHHLCETMGIGESWFGAQEQDRVRERVILPVLQVINHPFLSVKWGQGTALGVLGRTLPQCGVRTLSPGASSAVGLEGSGKKDLHMVCDVQLTSTGWGRRENPWWSLGIFPRVAVGMKCLYK